MSTATKSVQVWQSNGNAFWIVYDGMACEMSEVYQESGFLAEARALWSDEWDWEQCSDELVYIREEGSESLYRNRENPEAVLNLDDPDIDAPSLAAEWRCDDGIETLRVFAPSAINVQEYIG